VGEGIKYSWGCSKNVYQLLRIHEKRGKENFRKSVDKCLDREILSTKELENFHDGHVSTYVHITK
jgi:hypothetical protein